MFSVKVSKKRAQEVYREITAGSKTHLRFYAMLVASVMIACFGLIANSTAVVIGAMLVSPLMTPIFGVALGLLRGSPHLIARALTTEFVGVVLAIGSAYLIGLMQLTAGEATPEMLSRTQPNLVDLLVAVFAGFAGAYALVDERISPALPGVAIATAIVPPLATCGLCLALGAWMGAFGALLLFFANFVSILLISLLVFGIAGMSRSHVGSLRSLGRRFGPALIAFVLMATVMTHSLERILDDRKIYHTVQQTLIQEFASDHSCHLSDFIHHADPRTVQVLATVRSPRTVPPGRVFDIQRSLQTKLDRPVELVVRTLRSRDVSATGSSLQVVRPDLSGRFLTDGIAAPEAMESLAAQVLREQFENEPGFELTRVEYGKTSDDSPIIVAYVNTIRRMAIEEVASAEHHLQDRMNDPSLHLLLRVNAAKLEYRSGPVRVEWTDLSGATDDELTMLPETEAVVRSAIEELSDVSAIHVHFNFRGGGQRILAEVVGPNPVSPEVAGRIQDRICDEIGSEAELHLWYRNEFIVSRAGYSTYERLTDPQLLDRRSDLQVIFGSVKSQETNGGQHSAEEIESIESVVTVIDD